MHFDGNTWQQMTTPVGTPINGVFGFAADDVFAVGAGGVILRYDGAAWSPMNSGTGNALEAVWGRAANDVFAVGAGGTALHYDGNAGGNWAALPPTGTLEDFRAVDARATVVLVSPIRV